METGFSETTVRDAVLHAWQARSAPRWRTSTGRRWQRIAGQPDGGGLSRCLHLAMGVGAGLGLLGVCLIIAAMFLPPLFMVVPVLAAVVALALAANLGSGDSAAPAPSTEAGAPALLDLTRASRLAGQVAPYGEST
jgi:hypothetical protein